MTKSRIMASYVFATMLTLVLPSTAAADTPADVVNKLFAGMLAGDGAAISALVEADARLDRLRPDGSLHHGTFTDWINWVDQQEPGAANEQIFAVKTLSSSPALATVWAPFILHYKGELVGCGVNQFTLAKSNAGWRIMYGIDMPHKGDCTKFRELIG